MFRRGRDVTLSAADLLSTVSYYQDPEAIWVPYAGGSGSLGRPWSPKKCWFSI